MRHNKNSRPNKQQSDTRQRFREILSVLSKYEIVKGLTPVKLRLIVEELGPTYVKLGQIMSMRRDMLPVKYCEELAKLRTNVHPMEFEEVRAVIEGEYGTELDKMFTEFNPRALGSASIAQVHAATLRSDGSRVAVKVQRPGIRAMMARDIKLMRKLAKLVKMAGGVTNVLDFNAILDEMWFVSQQEMDFLIEAKQAEEFHERNKEILYTASPAVRQELTTSKVLVMEYIDGTQIDDLHTLRELGYDLREIGMKLADSYVKQVIDDAFFHADPHPGNLRIRDGKIVWIDLGMMGRLTSRDQQLFRDAVQAVVENDVSSLKTILLTMGVHTGKINHAQLYTDIDDMLTKYGSMELSGMDMGVMMEELLSLASKHRITMPKGVTILCRGMMTIEDVVCRLSPDINLVQIMGNHLKGDLFKRLNLEEELKENGRALYHSGKKMLHIPAQMSDLLGMTIKGQTKLNLELIGSEEPLASINKMVNKIIICIITAALLVGSCLICTTDMTPKILGIPALGMLGFFASIVLGGWLMWKILRKK